MTKDLTIKIRNTAQPNPEKYINYAYHSSVDQNSTLRFILYKKLYFRVDFKSLDGLDYQIVPQELTTLKSEDFKFITVDVVGFDLKHDGVEPRMLQQITACARIEEWNPDNQELFIYVFGLLRNPDKNKKWSGFIDISLSFYGF